MNILFFWAYHNTYCQPKFPDTFLLWWIDSFLVWRHAIIWANACILLIRSARYCVAWGKFSEKFRKLLPVLTTRHLSLSIDGNVYEACWAMLHSSETWGSNNPAVAMSQWLCHDLLDLWHQRQRWNTLCFTTTETWHWGYLISPSLSVTQMVRPCPVSKLSQTFRFQALERKEGLVRLGLNVWRLMSKYVA